MPTKVHPQGITPVELRLARASIRNEITSCTRCPAKHADPVPFRGPAPAEIAIVGESPGMNESRQGQPFVGPAGVHLADLLLRNRLRQKDIFILNSANCWFYRTPLPEEVQTCSSHLHSQLRLACPKYIIAFGGVAVEALRPGLELKRVVGRPLWWGVDHSMWTGTSPNPDGCIVFPMYHPAAALRNGTLKIKLDEQMANFTAFRAGDLDWTIRCLRCREDGEFWANDGLIYCRKHVPQVGNQATLW